MTNKQHFFLVRYVFFSLCVFIVDIGTKYYALNTIIAPHFLFSSVGFVLVKNTGIALSIPLTGLPQIIITILTLMGLIGYGVHQQWYISSPIGLSLITGGALGNLLERIKGNGVTDFLHIHPLFPVFNIADIAIFFGACILFLNINKTQIS